MTSSPLRLFIPTLMGFIFMGVFIWNITKIEPMSKASVSVATQVAEAPILITLKMAHPATEISIYHKDSRIWHASSPSLYSEIDVNLPDSNEYNFHVKAKWPENTPDTAISMTLEKQGKHPQSDTKWSFGHELSDIYQFTWK